MNINTNEASNVATNAFEKCTPHQSTPSYSCNQSDFLYVT